MSTKEQINTLITTGASLPPVNPYLDDTSTSYGDDSSSLTTRKKAGRSPAVPPKTGQTKTIAPDPKEYIAELERNEDEHVF